VLDERRGRQRVAGELHVAVEHGQRGAGADLAAHDRDHVHGLADAAFGQRHGAGQVELTAGRHVAEREQDHRRREAELHGVAVHDDRPRRDVDPQVDRRGRRPGDLHRERQALQLGEVRLAVERQVGCARQAEGNKNCGQDDERNAGDGHGWPCAREKR
jgi:hypothetical protein